MIILLGVSVAQNNTLLKTIKEQASEISHDAYLVFTVFGADPIWFHIILFAALLYLSSG